MASVFLAAALSRGPAAFLFWVPLDIPLSLKQVLQKLT